MCVDHDLCCVVCLHFILMWFFSCWLLLTNVNLVPDIYFILHWVLISCIKWSVLVSTYCLYLFKCLPYVADPLFAFTGWVDIRKGRCSSYAQQSRSFTSKCHREVNDICSSMNLDL
jgi:hypothetical protein